MSVLAIDAGTTGVTALIVADDGTVAGRGYQEFRQYFPEPGWVEHLPEGIWQATLAACAQAIQAAGRPWPENRPCTITKSPSATIVPDSYFNVGGKPLTRLNRPARPGAM